VRRRFPVAFRLPPLASWPSFPATGIRLPRGRPTGGWSNPPDRNGVSMFRTVEMRPVSGAPSTPGPWCSRGRLEHTGHHCRLPAAGPVPRSCFHHPRVWVTRLTRVHVIRPHPVFPLPVTDGWSTGPWASSRASHPAVTSDACQERGQALSTRPELTADHDRALHLGQLTHTVRPHVARSIPVSPTTKAGKHKGSSASVPEPLTLLCVVKWRSAC
jgi:hypothetical protein